jgi:GTP-binding protein
MIESYLTTRKTLKGLVLIMDIRRDPGAVESEFAEWLALRRLPVVMVLTKADKLSRAKRLNRQGAVAKAFPETDTEIILFSAKTRMGCDRLWKVLEALVAVDDTGPLER